MIDSDQQKKNKNTVNESEADQSKAIMVLDELLDSLQEGIDLLDDLKMHREVNLVHIMH